ncbi:asparagine synthase (glutamine-hydrolyzing) [Tepidibacter thalassicus]|uniref:asparagine synthase (glutamine-hydrolyzing) n=1 Tax=Tepidibacter thalassicus DSM 15285 TaxID=1123350 RepID=A0A1M5SYF1_9FIRM|nr:asparagine synthase (glutamine-hydrolyzing) [Tepidibacter thalassicus]SHH43492.1 asparagine synthase (glutamine-hydrolysing) [Tepidibacter thalassicus DSM 15285]
MCGICGFTNFNNDDIDSNVLKNMILSLKYRGPDEKGEYVKKHIKLGHTRLKIIDLEHGTQPSFSKNGQIAVIFNGEIYNHIQLRKDLEEKGHTFKTRCDTEVLPKLYEEYGIKFIEKLRGVFAIALYDNRSSDLYLIRDRIGIKPLYYFIDDKDIIFASEIKSLLTHPKISASFDMRFVNYYLKIGLVPTPHTIYKGIKKINPGTYLHVSQNGVMEHRYWDFPINNRRNITNENLNDYIDMFKKKLKECVMIRMESDIKPIGTYLSGGIDSSTVTSIAQNYSDDTIKAFNFTFRNKNNVERDESKYAKFLAEHIGADYNQLYYSDNSFELIEKTLYHLEEPTINIFNAQTFYQMASTVKDHNMRVVLMGEGSDEILGGYYFHIMEKIRTSINESVNNEISKEYRKLPGRMNLSYQACEKYFQLHNDVADFIQDDIGVYIPYLVEPYIQRNYILSKKLPNLFNYYSEISVNDIIDEPDTHSRFDKELYYDVKTRLIDYIIPTREKINMVFGIECRFPFLDHELIELVSCIPEEKLIENFDNKAFLKKAVEEIVPPVIINRPKHGLAIKSEVDLTKHKCLSKAYIEKTGYFDYQTLTNLIQEYKNTNKPYLEFSLGTLVERILAIQLLHKIFIEGKFRYE